MPKLPHKEDREIMAECVYLHYKKELDQAVVGEKLGLHQSQVSKLLKRAKDEGIFELEVRINHPYYKELEESMKSAFHLRDVKIVKSEESNIGSDTHLAREIGVEAARYFEGKSKRGDKAGISGGQTMFEVVNALHHPPNYIKLYPLVSWGAQDLRIKHIQPSTLVSLWWARFNNTEAYKLDLPYLSSDDSLKPIKEAAKNLFQELENINFIITSVGRVDKGSTFAQWVEDIGFNIEDLKKDGAIGDFIGHPIDRNGEEIKGYSIKKFKDLVASSINIEQTNKIVLKNDPTQFVILAAGGYRKLDSIAACLCGRLCNVLITDNEVAQDLLDLYEKGRFANL